MCCPSESLSDCIHAIVFVFVSSIMDKHGVLIHKTGRCRNAARGEHLVLEIRSPTDKHTDTLIAILRMLSEKK